MNHILETAKPLTDWLYTESGLRYRWISLTKEEVAILKERPQGQLKSKDILACKADI